MSRSFFLAAAVLLLVSCSREAEPVAPTTGQSTAAPTANVATETTASVPATPALPLPLATDVVKKLYDEANAERSPFFQTDDRKRVDAFFAPELGTMIWNDAVDAKGEVGALGADPLYDAQDSDIKEFAIAPAVATASGADVVVTFKNFDQPHRFVYAMVPVAGQWKIADIRYDTGHTLQSMFKDYNAALTATTATTASQK
jgi:hypothetical protein